MDGFFTALRSGTNLVDGNLLVEMKEYGSHLVGTSHQMFEGIREFINRCNLKALMSSGKLLKNALNDSVVPINAENKECPKNIQVLDDNTSTMQSYDVEAISSWVRVLSTDPTQSQVDVKEEQGKALMHVINVINETLGGVDYWLVQEMVDGRPSSKEGADVEPEIQVDGRRQRAATASWTKARCVSCCSRRRRRQNCGKPKRRRSMKSWRVKMRNLRCPCSFFRLRCEWCRRS